MTLYKDAPHQLSSGDKQLSYWVELSIKGAYVQEHRVSVLF